MVVGQDSSVGLATLYRLDSLGIECQWGSIFRTCPDQPWCPPSLLYNGKWVSFQGVKQLGCGVDHPQPRLKKE